MSYILIVEDDESTAELIKFTLESKKFTVELAENGAIALKKVRTRAPDLIILDIMLPGMDGFQICEMIKHNILYQNLPVIILSAKIRREDIDKGMEKGADEYITKPFEPARLIERINFHISNKAKKGAQYERAVQKDQ